MYNLKKMLTFLVAGVSNVNNVITHRNLPLTLDN